MTYLDWAATAPPDPDIITLQAEAALEFPGNPSSPYPAGKAAKAALEEARERCAAVLGCRPDQLAFTSGGTEADAIVLLARLLLREPGTVLVGGLEHPAVAEPAAMLGRFGWSIKTVDPEADGRIAPERLAAALNKNPDTRLVAVMGVNNEVGSVQPLEELAAAVRKFERTAAEAAGGRSPRPIHFHADLVQALGKVPVDLGALDVDSAAFSAHKIRGPRGVGLLYHRNPKMEVLLKGGGQEQGVRPGTENVAGAISLAAALEAHGRPDPRTAENGAWLRRKIEGLDGARIIPEARRGSSDDDPRYAPGILAVAFPPVPGEVLARVLAETGYAVSTGSACSHNKKGKRPKSMAAMKVPKDVAEGMIRISIGPTTTRAELEGFLAALRQAVDVLGRAAGR